MEHRRASIWISSLLLAAAGWAAWPYGLDSWNTWRAVLAGALAGLALAPWSAVVAAAATASRMRLEVMELAERIRRQALADQQDYVDTVEAKSRAAVAEATRRSHAALAAQQAAEVARRQYEQAAADAAQRVAAAEASAADAERRRRNATGTVARCRRRLERQN